jgi:Fe2+ transport system protein FeoA
MVGTIVRIEAEDGELLRYLAVLGLIPQARLEVGAVAPFGGPVLVRLGRAEYALGRDVASKIFVKET